MRNDHKQFLYGMNISTEMLIRYNFEEELVFKSETPDNTAFKSHQ